MPSVEEIKRMMKPAEKREESKLLLSSGSSMLNLACSGDVRGAFRAGYYCFIIGDSQSGKTWIAVNTLAEAANDPRFQKYRLIYDPTEHGALMNLRKFFGSKLVERIEVMDPPSDTAEEFYYNLDDALNGDRPCIYVLDSQDGLSDNAEQTKFEEVKAASRKGKQTTGSYNVSKPKVHSANIRQFIRPLRSTGSILMVLNQTRDSFDPFKPKSYSGGRALWFYATMQMTSSVKKHIMKDIHGKKRELGVIVKAVVKKSRETGRVRTVDVPILHSYGIDDVGSCVDYMVDENAWTKNKTGFIEAVGLGPIVKKRRDDLIRKIEEDDLVDDLRLLVQQTWNEVEQACEVSRKKRYE